MSRRQHEESGAMERRSRGQLSRGEARTAFNPFSLVRRIAEDMDRMFEGVGLPTFSGLGLRELESFTPKVDMFKQDGKLVVRADLPGVDLNEVNVEILGNTIRIEGERKYEHEEDEGGIYRVERSYGRFAREIPLPEGVNPETATATFKNGVLEISLEAPVTEQRRKIEVKGEESASKTEQAQTQSEQATMSREGEPKAETTGKTEEKGTKAA
jgi:HSP20 family protein